MSSIANQSREASSKRKEFRYFDMDALFRAAQPGKLIVRADTLPAGTPVVLYARKSPKSLPKTVVIHRRNRRLVMGRNLSEQLDQLRYFAKSRAWKVVGEYAVTTSGYDSEYGRIGILPAVSIAQRYHRKTGTMPVIVAETVDRFIRHSKEKPFSGLEEWHLRELKHESWGVPLATIARPDSPTVSRSTQIKRGHKAKDNKGGKPIKGRDAFRGRWLSVAIHLRGQGLGWRTIAKEITRKAGKSISHMGIRGWLERV